MENDIYVLTVTENDTSIRPAMTLKSYLQQNGLTVAAFARLVGLPKMTVYRHVHQGRVPRRPTLAKYEVTTNGQVTAADFYVSQQ